MPHQSDIDALRDALAREREAKQAYIAELELCGKELERRQHRIRELETAAQWEPVEDGAQVQMEHFYWQYDAGEVSKWDYETGHPYDQMDLPAEWCLMRRTYAAPAAEDGAQWEPVEDGYTYTDENEDTITVSEGGSLLYIRDDNSWVKLPDTVRLCRRVDAAPGAAEAEPLPCPRCRHDAVVFEADDGWLVECNNTGNCSRGVGGYESRAAAVSAWNCRTAAEVTQ